MTRRRWPRMGARIVVAAAACGLAPAAPSGAAAGAVGLGPVSAAPSIVGAYTVHVDVGGTDLHVMEIDAADPSTGDFSGTVTAPSRMPVTGTLAGRRLSMQWADPDGSGYLATFTGTVAADGSMAGTSSGTSAGTSSGTSRGTSGDDGSWKATPVGPVLGLGDSVAAGYGLGRSQGYPDNPDAYSALLDGSDARSYAVEGACASSAERGCPALSVNEQLTRVPLAFRPRIVTLTVGADDIDFAGCLRALFDPADPDIDMNRAGDPCNPRALGASLADFGPALGADLATIAARYPAAKVLVMDYYNPFPRQRDPLCATSEALTVLEAHAEGSSWARTVEAYFLHRPAFAAEAAGVQGQVYADAATVLARLNEVIDHEAAAHGATTVDTGGSFVGNSMCAPEANEYAFAPTVQMTLSAGPASARLEAGGRLACPHPVAEDDWNLRLSARWALGALSLRAGVNCMPHPTPMGQQAIATDFADALS